MNKDKKLDDALDFVDSLSKKTDHAVNNVNPTLNIESNFDKT